jgi:hypothetical protein
MSRYIVVVIALVFGPVAYGQTIDFEDLTLPGANTFVNGSAAVVSPATAANSTFTSHGATFNNHYDTSFGGFWFGWSYSNVVNNVTPGPANQYAAYLLNGGNGSPTYAVASVDTFGGVVPTIDLPAGRRPVSMQLTNTTYAARIVLFGEDPNHFARQFDVAHQDIFTLTIRGLDALGALTGTVVVNLADYRVPGSVAQPNVITGWTTVDLTPLGNATKLTFAMDSTDHFIDNSTNPPTDYGMNTPAYFALDNLTLVPVPEPGTLVLAGLAAIAFVRRCRRGPGRRSWAA